MASSGPEGGGQERLKVGEKVVLTDDYASHGDASGGPLKPGDVGVLEQDDHDSKPFKVNFNGRSYFYVEAALKRAPAGGSGGALRAGERARVRPVSVDEATRLQAGHGGCVAAQLPVVSFLPRVCTSRIRLSPCYCCCCCCCWACCRAHTRCPALPQVGRLHGRAHRKGRRGRRGGL